MCGKSPRLGNPARRIAIKSRYFLVIFVFMKKLLMLAAMAVSLSSFAQTFAPKEGDNVDFYPPVSAYLDCVIHIENKTNSTLSLEYKKIVADFPSTWNAAFCDNRNCFEGFVEQDTFSPIPAGDEKNSIKITVYPNGKADTAFIQYAIWDRANPSYIDTWTFNVYVRWGADVNNQSISHLGQVFPNPCQDELNIGTANSNIEQAWVIDVKGSKIPVAVNQGVVNTSTFVNGMYWIQWKSGKSINSMPFSVLR